MNYQIQSDNMELTPSMGELAKSKLVKLSRHYKNVPEDSVSCRVVMNTAPVEAFTVKVQLDLNGAKYFTDETSYTLETALVNAVEELDRQLEKVKNQHEAKWKDKREAKRVITDDIL